MLLAPRRTLLQALTEEALRLFFPLCALHAAAWPLLWVWLHRLNLPLIDAAPPSVWHGQEMLFGSYGAALLGFILTAVPEWTTTARPSPRFLLGLAALWGGARAIGLFGADWVSLAAALADLGWLAALIWFVARVSWRTRSSSLLGFLSWLGVLLACQGVLRWAIAVENVALAQTTLRVALLAFAALLALSLARIGPAITNRVLDPTRRTTPFRPHPGRRNLAAILVAFCVVGQMIGVSVEVQGFLHIACGAAFMDRVAESFIGRRFFSLELLALPGAALLGGCGFILMGAGLLGAPGAEMAGVHVLAMGGLGLAVLGVFSIAGKLHTDQPLRFASWHGWVFVLAIAAMMLRIMPSFGIWPPGPAHGLASLMWACAFLLWLRLYWPAFSSRLAPTPQAQDIHRS